MKGAFYLVLTGFLLGTAGIWVKLIGENISPFLLTFFRTILAALLVLVFAVSTGNADIRGMFRMKRREAVYFLAAGFFGVTIGFGFFVKSFSYIPVASAVFLVYVYPVATALLSMVLLKEKMGKRDVLSLVMVIAGVWLIYGSEGGMGTNVFGNLLALSAGLGYSVLLVFMRFFERRGMPYWKVVFWPMVTGGMILLAFTPFETFAFSVEGYVPPYLLALALVSFAGYVLYAKALGYVKAHIAVIVVALTEPLTAAVLAFMILGEVLPRYVLAGGLLIILANILLNPRHN